MSRFTLIDTAARQAMRTAFDGSTRRRALQLLASGAALAMAGCQKPREAILPYVNTPENETPGVPRRFATSLSLAGYGRGVTAVAIDGRPIKIDGNVAHPASLGATDVFAEAAILDLYDPNRSKTARGPAGPASWETFIDALRTRLATANDNGDGLVILTARLTSPTLLRQMTALQARYPKMRWTRYEPAHDDNSREGSRLAFGRAVRQRPRFQDADVLLCLDADPVGPGPDQISGAQALTQRRSPGAPSGLSRIYVAEASMSQTGVLADHRIAADPAAARAIALAVARRLGAQTPDAPTTPKVARFAKAVAEDLATHPGRALVLVGEEQPPEMHALIHWINGRLHAPLDAAPAPDPHEEAHAASLAALASAARSGTIKTLIILDTNPVYDTPAFEALIGHIPFSAHVGLYLDETGRAATWHAPLSHALESWSDVRGADGSASLVQPVIRPLYETWSAAALFAALLGQPDVSSRDVVRQTWSQLDDPDWTRALALGIIAQPPPPVSAVGDARLVIPPPPPPGTVLSFRVDSCLWDGRFAANAWLQECPEALTKEVWGRALRVSAADASRWAVQTGDTVRLSVEGAAIEAAVLVAPGQAAGVVTLPLGGGRAEAGPIGSALGANPNPLRGAGLAWRRSGVRVERVAGKSRVLETQSAVSLGQGTDKLLPRLSLAGLAAVAAHRPEPPPSLLEDAPRGDHAWAMTIDAQSCIGCSACVVACQSENNGSVVGPEEIEAGRDMHWLRIDRYDLGTDEDPQPGFLPVPCMQCEHAPCEPVCPVEASVHDHEGLNDQVYNRCVGTRFCQANCPYKVRRFNYRDYEAGGVYGDLDVSALKAQRNPEVTVRERGVMEKCTYCIQRIAAARSDSERSGQPILDGSLKTACQSACPTQAITFGDLKDPVSRVTALRREPRGYALLEELGTRPRTTYLARVRNPNAALEGGPGGEP